MQVPFSEIKHLIPSSIFNEYGQLTGNYVYADQIVYIVEDGRIEIWLNRETCDASDPDGLIYDYDEETLRSLNGQGL
jgi:hypothetical protein